MNLAAIYVRALAATCCVLLIHTLPAPVHILALVRDHVRTPERPLDRVPDLGSPADQPLAPIPSW